MHIVYKVHGAFVNLSSRISGRERQRENNNRRQVTRMVPGRGGVLFFFAFKIRPNWEGKY